MQRFIGAVFGCLATSWALAQTGGFVIPDAVFAIEGDPAYGEYLGAECAGCHAGGAGTIPQIKGYDPIYFVTAMHEYRAGMRENEAMQLIAGRLSDDEIAALAAYFSTAD